MSEVITRDLFSAVCESNIDLIKQLIQSGENVDIRDEDKGLLLAEAIKVGNTEVIRLLIEAGASLYEEDINDNENYEILLRSGIDINARNDDGIPPIVGAALARQTKMLKTLISLGADINVFKEERFIKGYKKLIKADDELSRILQQAFAEIKLIESSGELLFKACNFNDYNTVKALLDAGAYVNYRDSENNQTALQFAILGERDSAIIFLLINAGTNLHTINKQLQTPLTSAIQKKRADVVSAIINAGADVNMLCNGTPPLLSAAIENNKEIMTLLIDAGARIDKIDIINQKILNYLASLIKDKEVINLLLRQSQIPECFRDVIGNKLAKELI